MSMTYRQLVALSDAYLVLRAMYECSPAGISRNFMAGSIAALEREFPELAAYKISIDDVVQKQVVAAVPDGRVQ